MQLTLKIIKLRHDCMLSEKGISDNLQGSKVKHLSDSFDPNNKFWAKKLENVPVSIHIKSETSNGRAEAKRKDCKDENISRYHIWNFT